METHTAHNKAYASGTLKDANTYTYILYNVAFQLKLERNHKWDRNIIPKTGHVHQDMTRNGKTTINTPMFLSRCALKV